MSFFDQYFTSIPSYNNNGTNILVIGPHADEFTSINSALSAQEELNRIILERLNLYGLSHKLKNIVKFYKEFIFVIIERINMQISTVCHICH